MIIEITDNSTPLLGSIALVSQEVAYEIMSKVGNRVRENAGKAMNQTRHRHSWLSKRGGNGKRTPYYSKTEQKNLGQRTKVDGSTDNPKSMASMISSNLVEHAGVLYVGGRNRKKTVIVRRDGERVGTATLNAISKHTQSIINKLDRGERNKYHGWGSGGSQKQSMPNFSGAKYKGRGFMNEGFRNSTPYMKQELTNGYEQTIGRAVNKVKVNLVPSKRRVS